jgi:hypothetical protein
MPSPAMNNTKWDELRLAMYALDPPPRWSTLATNGYQSQPDSEWFYHFRVGGYADILHVDIFADSPEHRRAIYAELKRIHVPGVETAEGFRVFGYVSTGEAVDFL